MTWWTDLLGWIHPGPIPPAPTPVPSPTPDADVSIELLKLINAARTTSALAALSPDARLVAAAQEHATRMAAVGVLAHQGILDGTPWRRASNAGYQPTEVAENIAEGFPNAAAVVSAWLADPPHRVNILGPSSNFGAAVAADGTGRLWWSATFAEPRA